MVASRNSVSTGVFANAVLLPGESLEARQATVATWVSTFCPNSPGEAALVARVADVLVRLDRIDAHERRLVESGVEQQISDSQAFKTVALTENAIQATRAMAETMEGASSGISIESFQRLAPALQQTLSMAEAADVPMSLLARVKDALNAALIDTVLDVGAEIFGEIATAARDVEAWLMVARKTREAVLAAERQRLSGDPTLADETQLRKLDQHRARLRRELDWLLRLLSQVRELARPENAGSGSFSVELRVVGRPDLACR